MIVDVVRGELGSVCRLGSVQVIEGRRLESFPHVHHTTATMRGELRPGVTALELLKAVFPPASVTGAPKQAAIDLINRLEPFHRGAYTGALGYFGLDGRWDLSVAIRMAVVDGENLSFNVGGGIVAGSDPGEEYNETLGKAAGFLQVLAGEGPF